MGKNIVNNVITIEQKICLIANNAKFVCGDWIIIAGFLTNALLDGKNGPFILF